MMESFAKTTARPYRSLRKFSFAESTGDDDLDQATYNAKLKLVCSINVMKQNKHVLKVYNPNYSSSQLDAKEYDKDRLSREKRFIVDKMRLYCLRVFGWHSEFCPLVCIVKGDCNHRDRKKHLMSDPSCKRFLPILENFESEYEQFTRSTAFEADVSENVDFVADYNRVKFTFKILGINHIRYEQTPNGWHFSHCKCNKGENCAPKLEPYFVIRRVTGVKHNLCQSFCPMYSPEFRTDYYASFNHEDSSEEELAQEKNEREDTTVGKGDILKEDDTVEEDETLEEDESLEEEDETSEEDDILEDETSEEDDILEDETSEEDDISEADESFSS